MDISTFVETSLRIENYFENANDTDQRRQKVVLNYVDYAGRDEDSIYEQLRIIFTFNFVREICMY